MILKKFVEDLTRNAEQAPQILDAEITNIDIIKVQHDGTETVERIEITMSNGAVNYKFISAFNLPKLQNP